MEPHQRIACGLVLLALAGRSFHVELDAFRNNGIHSTRSTRNGPTDDDERSFIYMDLHICREQKFTMNQLLPTEAVMDIEISYQCQGPAYDNFTERMLQYAQQEQASSKPGWGRRPFPFPDNKMIFAMGNSHTRQALDAVLCQYHSLVDWLQINDDWTRTIRFKNNATLVVIINSPIVYSHNWTQQIGKVVGYPFSNFDAVVMGRFNPYIEGSVSNYGRKFDRQMKFYSQTMPGVNFAHILAPSVSKTADVFQGPVIGVSMFALDGHPLTYNETLEAANTWKAKNRTNIAFVSGRSHIDRLGAECGSDVHYVVGICRNIGDGLRQGRTPTAMHRCTGAQGGHPDLVAWDIIETLHELLPQS